ncbi:MAG: YigZ family protein [Lachnospiraceae bacterium]|nr:YigZ family protein [Lachnospiraceae bacterium]
MAERYKTVYQGGTGEIIEKKSRFIATVIPIASEEEAIAFIDSMKKKYWDATHNCSAYVLGRNHELARCSDDGEPQKTAGRPMLDVLLGEGIHNTAVVVTRYFGGTLLGTGGLVRAYQGAAKEGLKNSLIIEKIYGTPLTIRTDYNGIGKIQYLIAQNQLTTLSTEYTDTVTVQVLLTPEELGSFTKKVMEATNGRAVLEPGDPVYFADVSGEIMLFES